MQLNDCWQWKAAGPRLPDWIHECPRSNLCLREGRVKKNGSKVLFPNPPSASRLFLRPERSKCHKQLFPKTICLSSEKSGIPGKVSSCPGESSVCYRPTTVIRDAWKSLQFTLHLSSAILHEILCPVSLCAFRIPKLSTVSRNTFLPLRE